MLRRSARSAIARVLHRTGADRAIGRMSGLSDRPLILGYHRVFAARAPADSPGVPGMGIGVATLERHLEFIARRFRFVSLDEMGRAIEKKRASGLATVTFDDGYVDFHDHAFPLLQRMGIPGSVFVVTALLERGGEFLHDRVYAATVRALTRLPPAQVAALLTRQGVAAPRLPGQPFAATRVLLRSLDQEALLRLCAVLETEFGKPEMSPRSLTWDELSRMSRAGVTVGSHTKTHALLTRESADRVLEETVASKLQIEARLGVTVSHFVYPDGAFDQDAVRAVKAAGYRYAYTGCEHRDPDHPLLTLPRRVLWEGSTRGILGAFSPDVLSSQLNGVFDRVGPCPDRHEDAAPSEARRVPTVVAVVAPSLDVVGGQSVQADALCKGLRLDGFGVIFVATNPRFPKNLQWLRRVPFARTVLNEALYFLSLRKLLRADIVHVFSASFWSFLLAPAPAMVVASGLRKRVVLNYHSGEAGEHLDHWGLLVHPWLRLAHQLIVPSEYLRQEFARHGYDAHVVRNVVDTSRFAFRLRTPLSPLLLSTRNLEATYRVDRILSAFALVKSERAEATLTIAGAGSEESRLRKMARNLSGVTFLGAVAPGDMPSVCNSSDIFLNASVVDNQPLSLIEAFASGLPVVTTATGGIASMLRHDESGIVVPLEDPEAMARAVIALLADDERAQRIARAARVVAETYSWSCVRELWRRVYRGEPFEAPRPTEPLNVFEVPRDLRANPVVLNPRRALDA